MAKTKKPTARAVVKKPRGDDAKKKRGAELFPDTFDPVALELKRAREALGLSHSDLNRVTGISRTVLLGYERGRTRPGAREIRLLAKALQVTPNRLLFGTEEPFKSQPSFQQMLAVRRSPALILMAMFPMMPIVIAALNDEETMALVTLIGSLVQSRDPELYLKLTSFVNVALEKIADAESVPFSSMTNPAAVEEMSAEVSRRVEEGLAALKARGKPE